MPRSAARAHPRILVTVLCLGVTFAHAQQLRSIESQSYVTCVQSAFERRLDDFGVSSLQQTTERAFLDCQAEEDALYTTAVASAPGNTQAMVVVRAAVEQLKANLKAEMLAGGTARSFSDGTFISRPTCAIFQLRKGSSSAGTAD